MKRRTLPILPLCLVLGAVVNFPIAWMCMLHAPVPGSIEQAGRDEYRRIWDGHIEGGAGYRQIMRIDHTRFIGFERVRIQGGDIVTGELRDPNVRNLLLLRAGFPFHSLACRRAWNLGPQRLVGGIAITPRQMSPGGGNYGWVDALPTRPLPIGFALNTLLYAALLYALFLSPRWVPAVIRRLDPRPKPGHCPQCGYDLRGDVAAGCPECGWNRGEAEA